MLQNFGYDADELTSDLEQKKRERVLERVKKGSLKFLVATDVAARGLDIPSFLMSFNTNHLKSLRPISTEPDERAGPEQRVAISLVTHVERFVLDRIAKRYSIDLQEWPLPTDADVEAIVTERVTALLESRLRERDRIKTERSQRFVHLGRTFAENEDESPIIAMLLDDYYQTNIHAPLPQPSESSSQKKTKNQAQV